MPSAFSPVTYRSRRAGRRRRPLPSTCLAVEASLSRGTLLQARFSAADRAPPFRARPCELACFFLFLPHELLRRARREECTGVASFFETTSSNVAVGVRSLCKKIRLTARRLGRPSLTRGCTVRLFIAYSPRSPDSAGLDCRSRRVSAPRLEHSSRAGSSSLPQPSSRSASTSC